MLSTHVTDLTFGASNFILLDSLGYDTIHCMTLYDGAHRHAIILEADSIVVILYYLGASIKIF